MEFCQGFGSAIDPQDHRKMLAYFEQLKSSDEGLEYSVTELLKEEISHQHEELVFLHWKVLEHHVQQRHQVLPSPVAVGLRKAMLAWLDVHSRNDVRSTPTYLRNKAAQVYALIFSKEFLSVWPSFMLDIMKICLGDNATDAGIDFYLRILLAIDVEVVDRSILHSESEQAQNQKIKDTMRETCIPDMVQSWYNLLIACSQDSKPSIASMCLNVIGAYIEWIDINMIANEKFLPLIFGFLSPNIDSDVREATCECLKEIVIKGMLPIDKLCLVEVLWPQIRPYCNLGEDEDIDYVIKLSKLVGGVGSTLVFAWSKFVKMEGIKNVTTAIPEVQQNYVRLLTAVEDKVAVCLQFLGHEDDDVSQQCVQFVLDYIDMLKKVQDLSPAQKQSIVVLFQTLAKKFKYDAEYCFESEGEEEAEFKDYLKGLKVTYENLIQLQPALVQENVLQLLKETLAEWQYAEFNDVEVCIRLVYLLGESLQTNLSNQFTNDEGAKTPLHHMMTVLTSSGVSNHPHPYVRLMFFETVSRYDRFFVLQTTDENVLLSVTQAFLDHRGIRATNPTIRSRSAYLLSKFIKTTCKNLQRFTEQLLAQIRDMLVLSPSNGVERVLSNDDQLFIYELAGTLIVNSSADVDAKNSFMTSLLRPLVEGFMPLLKRMHDVAKEEKAAGEEMPRSEEIATTVNYAMSYASRTSKAFSNKMTMANAGCSNVYTQTLHIFLNAFDVEVHHDIIHSGIRQYLHRMVICLEDEVLPFIPIAVEHLLKHCTTRALHQFIPLINQIINKFKKTIAPFLQQVFMPIVQTVFQVLAENQPQDGALTEDAKSVRRTYFQFLHATVSNHLTDVIVGQSQGDVEMVLSTIYQGAVDYPDPVAQKVCFNIFHKLVEAWKNSQNVIIRDFILQSIVPACFKAPLRPDFDLTDAQTMLILKDSSSIMKDLHGLMGNELIQALEVYLPTLKLGASAEEYCQALSQLDVKQFRNYTRSFFQRAHC